MADLMEQGIAGELAVSGATLRPCICGPCFGVTDVPANNQVSIRHMTRNYPNREGSKPGQGQMACACLMDARSIAATVRNGGKLTAATELDIEYRTLKHHFDAKIYENQVFNNFEKGDDTVELTMGPNIADWPKMQPLTKHLLLKTAGSYHGSLTTDELLPSGEASSFRSNPEKISEYTMISRDPDYVGRAKKIRSLETKRREQFASGQVRSVQTGDVEFDALLGKLTKTLGCPASDITFGSLMVSDKIGDGSSREQAASCQKVLGGFANLANEYATKRYRSNLINWGLLPLRTEEKLEIPVGSYLLVREVEQVISECKNPVKVQLLDAVTGDVKKEIFCTLDTLTEDERKILLSGCLINYYRS